MRTLLCGLLISLCLAPAARAETLSLRRLLVMGLGQNYDLRVSALEVERAAAAVTGEEGRFDLHADLGLGVSRSETPAASALVAGDLATVTAGRIEAGLGRRFASGLQARLALTGERSDVDSLADRLDPAYRSALLLDLTQPLLRDRGSEVSTAAVAIAGTRRQQAALGYLAEAQRLAAAIESAYLALAQAETGERLAGLARDLAGELLEGNRRRFAAGLVPITEVDQARAALAGREEALLLARQQATLERIALVELVAQGGEPLPETWQVELPSTANESVPALEKALADGLQRRPELDRARLEIDARRLDLGYADNQRLPRLDLEAGASVSGLAGDDPGGNYDGAWSDAFGGALSADGASWYAGLRFSLPLQNRVAEARYRDAGARDLQARYRLKRAEIAATAEIRAAHASLTLGRERAAAAQQAALLAQTAYEQENRRLQEGLSDTFRVLTFQESMVAARIREAAAVADYCRARSALSLAMGDILERHDIVAALPRAGDQP